MLIRAIIVKSAIAGLCFVAAAAAIGQSLPEMRMTPTEIRASALDTNQNIEVELAAKPAKHKANPPLSRLGRRWVPHEGAAPLGSVEQSFAF